MRTTTRSLSCTTTTTSETDFAGPYHRYNTRLASRRQSHNCPSETPPACCRPNRKQNPPARPPQDHTQIDFQRYRDHNDIHGVKKPSRCCSRDTWYILLATLVAVAISGSLFYTIWTLGKDIDSLKDDLVKARKGSSFKTAEPSKAKGLNKVYSERFKMYLKDPTGRPDFALESTGGAVVSVDAEPFTPPKSLLGFILCEGLHSPNVMIQASTLPGECWAFKGHTASAVIQLITYVNVDAVTLEHIPPNISPSGSINSAPKDFKIWGLDDATKSRAKKLLGQFHYDIEGGTVQTFPIVNNTDYNKFVEFEVASNHGNEYFTCVYRLRVHGKAKQL